ncbi:thiamine phosphate synthase [Paenisporosarcina antarctica]|uniref:Thiamine-phosphate synthase n=1 Tax=Paenisporosarcina antarctica TaxID=417367 RepID=A0A4P6ZV45_9BACL|nr:thiamine phosphate synthase [Paenisporosarcina antarctica]QBP40211.1 thiamine phosphate synthase [Paenisporosarcina antarctica]
MNRNDLACYFIMGTQNCIEEPLHVLEDALKAGITIFQLREKGEGALTGKVLEQFARKCQELCKSYNVPFIVNDDVELALKIQADGVHVGQEDVSLTDIRENFIGRIVGVSVHTVEELDQAVKGRADYVGIGAIYETQSKSDAKAPAGLAFLQHARSLYRDFPLVAIGGITTKNAHETLKAGADGVAIISEICQSQDRYETVRACKVHI